MRSRVRLRLESFEERIVPSDVSAPVILQWFDGSYQTIERRAADIFAAGYGTVYTPPPGRADSSNFSVGYDVYDRFDLGGPGRPTLYGAETGLKSAIDAIHRFGGTWTLDFVANHNGFSDLSSTDGNGNSFGNAGGYPGFAITLPNDIDGDFHGAFEGGDIKGRLAGLIDIAQEKNYQFIRSPVQIDAQNLPAGMTAAFGRLANVPDPGNRRFYPDRDLDPIFVFDPTTGESNIPIYPFNSAEPLAGDAITENALGYLMRNAQWLIQVIGADGLRLDAAKHFDRWVLNYLDRAVYRQNPRLLLDGSTAYPFLFSEVFDGDKGFLQTFIRKDINPADPGRVGGNRDVLDFPLFFALQNNLTGDGLTNDWRNVVGASQDSQDDGLANNGSQGVAFVSSHDEFGPYLGNVAYAYTLMRPGNAIVYFNGKEFGDNRDFPKDGRGDALGGLYGDTIKKLVDIRSTHGRGNYIERWLEKEMLIYEREKSALVVLNNRLDGGFDSRTVQTSFAPGTPLLELTGNAADPVVDPFGDFPELLLVNADGTVNLRVPRNRAPGANGVEHGRGYFVYGPAGPQGTLNLTDVSHTITGETPTGATNGTARLSEIDVISANSFQVGLDTQAVNLLGFFRDQSADGDNALLRIDAGFDANGNGRVDYVSPGSVSYGFEEFTTVHTPGYFTADGNGQYAQSIDATQLAEGMHFITARAFRHREPGEGDAIFSDFRRSVYIDRLPAVATVDSFESIVSGVNENRRAVARSLDLTADNLHLFLDLPAALSDNDILAMVGAGSQANRIDRDLWTKDFSGLTHGNHVLTTVTFEISGRASIQRFAGQFTSTIFGAGLGDLDFDGDYDPADIGLFDQLLHSGDTQFNPAADLNGDGRISNSDLILLHDRLITVGANLPTLAAYYDLLGPPLAGFSNSEGQGITFFANAPTNTLPPLTVKWDIDNDGQFDDAAGTNVPLTWAQLQAVGIDDSGSHLVQLSVSDGTAATVFDTTLMVANVAPTASFGNSGNQYERKPVTVSFSNQFDPSNADTVAGFRYSYDFNNDGDFTDRGEVADSTTAAIQHAFNREGAFTVRGRIADKDGDYSEYTTTFTIANVDVLLAGADRGFVPRIRVLDAVTGRQKFNFLAFGADVRGGVRVAAGDVNGDGVLDVAAAAGPGVSPRVRVFDGVSAALIAEFAPYEIRFKGGVFVAAGDVNNDGYADVITGADAGGGPHVRVFDGKALAQAQFADELFALMAFEGKFKGGVRVAAGDVDGDGFADVLIVLGAGRAADVRVVSGQSGNDLPGWLAFPEKHVAGAFVAAGDVDGDGRAEATVSQAGAPGLVRLFRGDGSALLREVQPFAYFSPLPIGVRIAFTDRDGDGNADLLAGAGPRSGRVRIYRGILPTPFEQFDPFGWLYRGGVYVG